MSPRKKMEAASSSGRVSVLSGVMHSVVCVVGDEEDGVPRNSRRAAGVLYVKMGGGVAV